MSKAAFIGVGGKARKVRALYVGVNGKARRVARGYVGVGGKARLFYDAKATTVNGIPQQKMPGSP